MPSGVAIDYKYDGIDRLLEMKSTDGSIFYQYGYENGPDPVEVLDLVQNTALTRKYNSFGQLLEETNPYGLTSKWKYDDNARCIDHILPDGSSISYSYFGGHLVGVSRYSSSGNCLYTHSYRDFDQNGHVLDEDLIYNIGFQRTIHDLLERPSYQKSPWFSQSISYGPSNLVEKISSSLTGDKKIFLRCSKSIDSRRR